MRKSIVFASITAVLLLAAAPAALACGMTGYTGHSLVMCSCFDKKLGLSEDQQKRIDALRAKTGKKCAPLIAKLKAKKEELKKLWTAKKPKRNVIIAKKNQIYALKKKLSVIKTDAHLALNKILSDEQRQTLMKEKDTCCQVEGKSCPPGCQCPQCKQKAAEQPAKKSGCKGCPQKECPHHK